MKAILYMAMSLNGYIADKDGGEDFLSREDWDKFCGLARKHGNFIIGRKTYEAVKSWGEGYGFDSLEGVKKIIISQDENYKLDDGYLLATSPADALLKLHDFDSALVTGGAKVNSAFIKENLLDEIILNIEPAIIGQGIPLFAEGDFCKKLELISSENSKSGIITLVYKVKK